MFNQLRLLFFTVVISGALCSVDDYIIMSQCAYNKAIHIDAEGIVSATDSSQPQNITIIGHLNYVNNEFKITLFAKDTQRYLCFNNHWKLVGMKEIRDTCYFEETIAHGYFVFRSVVNLNRRIGFTHRGKAIGPKINTTDACYYFTKVGAVQFFHLHAVHLDAMLKNNMTTQTTISNQQLPIIGNTANKNCTQAGYIRKNNRCITPNKKPRKHNRMDSFSRATNNITNSSNLQNRCQHKLLNTSLSFQNIKNVKCKHSQLKSQRNRQTMFQNHHQGRPHTSSLRNNSSQSSTKFNFSNASSKPATLSIFQQQTTAATKIWHSQANNSQKLTLALTPMKSEQFKLLENTTYLSINSVPTKTISISTNDNKTTEKILVNKKSKWRTVQKPRNSTGNTLLRTVTSATKFNISLELPRNFYNESIKLLCKNLYKNCTNLNDMALNKQPSNFQEYNDTEFRNSYNLQTISKVEGNVGSGLEKQLERPNAGSLNNQLQSDNLFSLNKQFSLSTRATFREAFNCEPADSKPTATTFSPSTTRKSKISKIKYSTDASDKVTESLSRTPTTITNMHSTGLYEEGTAEVLWPLDNENAYKSNHFQISTNNTEQNGKKNKQKETNTGFSLAQNVATSISLLSMLRPPTPAALTVVSKRYNKLSYVRNKAGSIEMDNIDNIRLHPNLVADSENSNEDKLQGSNIEGDQVVAHKSENSQLNLVVGYLPTLATSVLPESIQIAKTKINKERKRLFYLLHHLNVEEYKYRL